jgi:trehalose 6-phosphate synthase/phosphatase
MPTSPIGFSGWEGWIVTGSGRLIVVANRLPVTVRRVGSSWRAVGNPGGLVSALAPVMREMHGLWIGWPGDAPVEHDTGYEAVLSRWLRDHDSVGVDLPPGIVHGFYEGYSNQTLWPLFHQFSSRLEFDPADWDAYVSANERFRDAVVNHLQPGDLVWVHDYHLMLLPELVREAAPQARIAFFLHIPFPSSDMFRLLPRRAELLSGLLGADAVAFHTHEYLQNFRHSLLRILGLRSRMDRVDTGSRVVRLEAHPIGIAAGEFTNLAEADRQVQGVIADLRHRFEGQRVLLAVDRLDYTKGIPERLRTFRQFLDRRPELREKVVLVQVAVPTREAIPNYGRLRQEVSELVGDLNGDYGTASWTPVVFIRRAISRSHLVALYATADVAWVTPLRDGMNLVAKEYVACHRDGGGALVLSEFAGAAAEMGEAFIVNPYDTQHTVLTLERVLKLSPDEQRERMTALYTRVQRNDAVAWSRHCLDSFTSHTDDSALELPRQVDTDALVAAVHDAKRRLFLLNYDGALVPFAPGLLDSIPSPLLLGLLTNLVAQPGNCVVVASGRPRADLERWFGAIPGLWLSAENGVLTRSPTTGTWEAPTGNLRPAWEEHVRPFLEHFVDRTPGSFVETKEYALVWHYGLSDPEFGEWLANELTSSLDSLLAETDLTAARGHKSVEVRPVWVNKNQVARRFIDDHRPDLCLAIGVDRDDEDLFAALPADSWTVRVGGGMSRARFRLAGPLAVERVLQRLGQPPVASPRD